MNNITHRCFDARTEPCSHVREWLEQFCSKSNTSAHNTWQLTLILEELFTNSMKHGYPGANDSTATLNIWPVWIELNACADGIHARYEDAAFEFNPLLNVQSPDYSGPAESWKLGGLGLPMITGIATDMRYERTANRNRLSLTLPAGQ